MKFCKQCGTLYDPQQGPCPKCATKDLVCEPRPMSDEEARRLRKKSWIQLLIGIPAFIGFIYLIIYVMRLLKG